MKWYYLFIHSTTIKKTFLILSHQSDMTETITKICWYIVNKLSEEALTTVINLVIENPNDKKNFNQFKLSVIIFLNVFSAIQCEAARELIKQYDIFFFFYFFISVFLSLSFSFFLYFTHVQF
jgi:hypothetical protein